MASKRANITACISYSLTVPKFPKRDGSVDEQFNAMMEKGCNQAKSGEGLPIDEAFARIRESI